MASMRSCIVIHQLKPITNCSGVWQDVLCKDFVSISATGQVAIDDNEIRLPIVGYATPHHYTPSPIQLFGVDQLRIVSSLTASPPNANSS